jgi:hypothetical protein
MKSLNIVILNPKALKLIKGMEDLNLIKVSEEPVSRLTSYLKKMRRNSATVPDLDEITSSVKDVRASRYNMYFENMISQCIIK